MQESSGITDSLNARDRPVYIVFAGVNGVGKSTFYRTDIWKDLVPAEASSCPRVNSDEILQGFKGNWNSGSDQLKAGKIAIREIESHFAQRESFNQETTLCGKIASKNVIKAHDLGYRIYLFYIGVAHPQIAIERIRHRADLGGHDISVEDVQRRFKESINKFHELAQYCEKAYVFDNTQEFVTVAQWDDGTLCWAGNIRSCGRWLIDNMSDE